MASKDVGVDPRLPSKDYTDPPATPLLDVGEFVKWSFYRAVIAEFVATLLFLYITIATVIGASRDAGCAGVGRLGIAWSFGGMIFVLVYCTAGISGTYTPIHQQTATLNILPMQQPRQLSTDVAPNFGRFNSIQLPFSCTSYLKTRLVPLFPSSFCSQELDLQS